MGHGKGVLVGVFIGFLPARRGADATAERRI
jgi:hypothetical protein